jgi:uncharacterized DUF497 family protein
MSAPPGFEWDEEMNDRCFAEYAFSFEDVVTIFARKDLEHLVLGPYDTGGEQRWLAVGALPWGTVFTVVYTARGENRRIIWVRPARRNERAEFYRHNEIEWQR